MANRGVGDPDFSFECEVVSRAGSTGLSAIGKVTSGSIRVNDRVAVRHWLSTGGLLGRVSAIARAEKIGDSGAWSEVRCDEGTPEDGFVAMEIDSPVRDVFLKSKKILGWRETGADILARATTYCVLLYQGLEPRPDETATILEALKASTAGTVRLLGAAPCTGPVPTGADEYVISVALLACEQAGIDFDPKKDVISYRSALQLNAFHTGVLGVVCARVG